MVDGPVAIIRSDPSMKQDAMISHNSGLFVLLNRRKNPGHIV